MTILAIAVRFLRQPRTIVWLILLAALGTVAGFVPLYDVLDLDVAWVLALVVGPAAGHVALGGTRLVLRDDPEVCPVRLFAGAGLAGPTLLLAPVMALAIHALHVTNCAPLTGMLYLLLDPVPTALLGAAWGALLGLAVARPWRAGLLFALLWIGAVGLAVLRIVDQPPVVLFSHWAGFFPGSVYDFAQPLPPNLLWLRLLTLLWILVPLAAALALRSARPRLVFVVLAAAVALLGLEQFGGLGANLDRSHIREALSEHRSSEHFELYLDPKIPKPARRIVEQDHEYAYARLRHLLGRAPQGKLTSYVYATPRRRRELLGAARTSIARPWSGEMHLVFTPRHPHPILAHELAHLFSRDIGDPTTGLSGKDGVLPNLGLIEGLAVAAAWDEEEYTPHGWSAALRKLDMAPRLARVMSMHGFWSAQPSRVYLSSGSFVAWLWQTRGLQPFVQAYPGADIAGAYDTPLPDLVTDWEHFLDKQKVDDRLRERARFRFTRPTIFQRTCVRCVALLAEDAGLALKQNRVADARALYAEALQHDPDRVGLMIRAGRVALRDGDVQDARRLAEQAMAHPGTVAPLTAAAQELLGDAAWVSSETEQALKLWHRAQAQPTSDGQRRRAAVKIAAARAGALRLLEYLQGVDKKRAAKLLGEAVSQGSAPELALYLRGLRRLHMFRLKWAIKDLEQAGDLTAISAAVERNRTLALADAVLLDGAPDGAEPLYRKLMVHERRDGARAMLSDRTARCRWVAKEDKPFRDLVHPLGKREQLVAPLDLLGIAPRTFLSYQQQGEDEHFDRNTLYDYMDGAAEVYLHQGFQRLAVRQYHNIEEGIGTITLEVFDMGSTENAETLVKAREGGLPSGRLRLKLDAGEMATYDGNVYAFCRAGYFVAVQGNFNVENPRRITLGRFVKRIDAGIYGSRAKE